MLRIPGPRIAQFFEFGDLRYEVAKVNVQGLGELQHLVKKNSLAPALDLASAAWVSRLQFEKEDLSAACAAYTIFPPFGWDLRPD